MADVCERAVEGGDGADNAHRFAHQQSELATHGRSDPLLKRIAVRHVGVLIEIRSCHGPGLRCDRIQHPCLAGPHLRYVSPALAQTSADGPQVSRPLGVGQTWPWAFIKRLAGRRDRPRDVSANRLRHDQKHFFTGRIDHPDRGIRRWGHPLTPNEKAVRVT